MTKPLLLWSRMLVNIDSLLSSKLCWSLLQSFHVHYAAVCVTSFISVDKELDPGFHYWQRQGILFFSKGSVAQPPCSVDTRGSFPRCKIAGA